MRRLLVAVALVLAAGLGLGGSRPAVTHAQPQAPLAPHGYVTETVHLTFYVDGGTTHSGMPTQEGWTVGCGWEVPDRAIVTMSDGSEYICADKGGTWEPWIDYYTPSYSRGYQWVNYYTEWCDPQRGCYATATFTW